MTAPQATAPSRRRRRWPWLLLLLVPAAPVAASWWFTEPLVDHPAETPPRVEPEPPAPVADTPPAWPAGTLSGAPAKRLLLDAMESATARISRVAGYTATFRRQERIGGRLGPEQTMAMKVRNQPFAIYLKFLAPKAGKEVVYAEGHHDNKLIAHNGDWTRRLVPRLAVPVNSSLALADSRHPVTEAGLLNLATKLLHFRKLDLDDPEAVTILDRTEDPEGRPRLRSIHTHPIHDGRRPFARVEILYDPETQFPVRISSYDWPDPEDAGELELAERYAYDDLKLGAPLTPADFDPANPEYAFMRF